MQILESSLDGVLTIAPKVFGDQRGFFYESYNERNFRNAGITSRFVQDNESYSRYGVVRGLHYQAAPYTQAKLVRVISGSVLDVIVDIRQGSPTFGQHLAIELSGDNKLQVFVPRGFAHGFAVLSEYALFSYKCDNFYMPPHERGIAHDDPVLNIDWRIPHHQRILSDKDRANPVMGEAELFDLNNREYLR